MYVMINDMAVPLSSGLYFSLLSQGAFTPLSGSAVLPPTGGNLMLLFIGVAMMVVAIAFVSAWIASRLLNSRVHSSSDAPTADQPKKPSKRLFSQLAAGSAALLLILMVGVHSASAEEEEEEQILIPQDTIGTEVIYGTDSVASDPAGLADEAVDAPNKIHFKRIGRKSPMELIGFDEAGHIKLPETAGVVGLSVLGSYPGYPGNSLLMAHNTYHGEVGLFAYLVRLKMNDIIYVSYPDGRELKFKVTDINTYAFDAVPDSALDLTGESRMTMISCCGGFDKKLGTSRKRCVVVAKPVEEVAN